MAPEMNVPKLRFPNFNEEWTKCKLSDAGIQIIDGDRGKNYPNGNDFSSNGYCLFLNAKNVTKNGFSFIEKSFVSKEKDSQLRKGKLQRFDIVLTTRGSIGHISYYDLNIPFENLRINSGMVLIRTNKEKVNSDYLYKFLNSNHTQKEIQIVAFGSAQPQLTVSEISKFFISFPSINEQTKIASFLTAVDDKIQALKKKKELLEQYKKGVMQQLFSQALRFKREDGTDYPEWEEKRLGEVFYSEKGVGISKSKIDENGAHQCILYGELYTKYNEVVKKIYSRTNELEGTDSRIGDLLIPCSTTTTGIDLANVTALNIENVKLGGDITILRSDIKINNIFFAYYLTNFKKEEIASYAQGSTIVHLYFSHIREMKIEHPCLEEQTKIANFLSAIDDKIAHCQQELAGMELWKKGLLQQMFC